MTKNRATGGPTSNTDFSDKVEYRIEQYNKVLLQRLDTLKLPSGEVYGGTDEIKKEFYEREKKVLGRLAIRTGKAYVPKKSRDGR